MEKSVYYKFENNDSFSCVFTNLEDVKDHIECGVDDLTEKDEVYYTITPIWLTEEEFENLPEVE